MYDARLSWKPILILLSLALVWGANMAIIKIVALHGAVVGLIFGAEFGLIHRYPISLLHAFSFFTPVLGVILSGILIMGKTIRLNLIVALVFVSLGLVLVNHQPPVKSVGLSEP